MPLKRLFFWFALLALSCLTALAQTKAAPPATSSERVSEAQAELEKNALGLLAEALKEAGGLKHVENRVRLQSVALALLWPRDKEAARALFDEAAAGVMALIAEADPSDPQFQNTRNLVTELRSQLVQVAAPHDAKLALDFLRRTRQPAPFTYPNASYKQPDQELMLELSLAAQIAAQDPKQALRMAEESLSKGVSHNLPQVLQQLAAKDREAATSLAAQIIKKLRVEDVARDYEVSNVAIQLLRQTRAEAAAAPPDGPSSIVIEQGRVIANLHVNGGFTLEEGSRRQLVETLVAAALSSAPAQFAGVSMNIANALVEAQPEIEKYAPARAAALKRRALELESQYNPRGRAWREYQTVMQSGSIEALLEAAPKAPPEVSDQLYTSAAWKALGENNLERARQIAENIAHPETRARLLGEMERQFRMRAVEQGTIEDARQLVARISRVEEKVATLIQLSSTAMNRGDKTGARALLEEARALAGRGENSARFYALLSVAHAYALLDESAAFEIVEGAVDRLNELLAAAAVVDGFGQEAFREGELATQGGYIWGEMIDRSAQALAVLAPKDFERARLATQRFQRTDARVLAELHLAQQILQSMPTKGGGPQALPLQGRRFPTM